VVPLSGDRAVASGWGKNEHNFLLRRSSVGCEEKKTNRYTVALQVVWETVGGQIGKKFSGRWTLFRFIIRY
jgi:hypothetical protein